MNLLGKHSGHRAWIVNDHTIKCVDCSHTIDLSRSSATSTSGTSNGLPLGLSDVTACQFHIGERDGACGPCRSETIEGLPMEWRSTITNDPKNCAEWHQLRERFGAKK